MNKKQKILITGSSGTIGTRLFQTLLAEGHTVVGVDIKPNQWDEQLNARTTIVDLRSRDAVLSALPTDVDLVIHLAANARVYNLVVDPSLALDNIEMTFNILEFVRLNDIKKIFFASSREVYGNSAKITRNEEDVHLSQCESPYTASKISGEALISGYRHCYGIDAVILRFSNVYGMYDSSDRVIPLFIKQCLHEQDIVVYGDSKILDFTYIDDCVTGIVQAIDDFNRIKNEVYNLAYGEGTSIVEVARRIQSQFGSKNTIRIESNRTGEVVTYIADLTKAKNAFGYAPTISIEEGIKRSIDWYSKNLYRT